MRGAATGQAKHQEEGRTRTTERVRTSMRDIFGDRTGVRQERNPFRTGDYPQGLGGPRRNPPPSVGHESPEGAAGTGLEMPRRERRKSVHDLSDEESSKVLRLSKLNEGTSPELIKRMLGEMTGDEAKKFWKKIALKYHPDKGGDPKVFVHIQNLLGKTYRDQKF